MNTKTKLLYVGFRALSTCCLYAAFLMITSCGDNVVNPDSPEPDGEDMIPVTVSRVEDRSATPLNWLRKALILALNDSAEAFVNRSSK